MMLDRPVISSHSSRNGSPLRPTYSSSSSHNHTNIPDDMHPVISDGRVAVITGGASGIGRAAALELANENPSTLNPLISRLGLKIAIADVDEARLQEVGKQVASIVGDANVLIVPTDVSKLEQVIQLKDKVYEQWGEVRIMKMFWSTLAGVPNIPLPFLCRGHPITLLHTFLLSSYQLLRIIIMSCNVSLIVAVLMNNAGIGLRGTSWDGLDNWKTVFDVNLFGIVNVQQTFVPVSHDPSRKPVYDHQHRLETRHHQPSVSVSRPLVSEILQYFDVIQFSSSSLYLRLNSPVVLPLSFSRVVYAINGSGNAAYNASKAAIKSLTEGLAFELRERPQPNVTAHLFIPGWTHTGLTGANSNAKPPGAWSAEETVLYMLDKVRAGDFYVVCPDNETRRELDQLRIMWGADDIVQGRPALSRWHKDYKALFEEFIANGLAGL
ncbi:hypothetical protein D9758_007064 [Tetrapyrgos nigripes]|uniref:Uncharacterized protein n=1 Tax=Tetrapyrgos nigripes TaxID=182062 RepID=A0A8H5LMQ7_9AGAR|nr:hypothetical protein D9758_007064 [Tetrapyrgos nigripes]